MFTKKHALFIFFSLQVISSFAMQEGNGENKPMQRNASDALEIQHAADADKVKYVEHSDLSKPKDKLDEEDINNIKNLISAVEVSDELKDLINKNPEAKEIYDLLNSK